MDIKGFETRPLRVDGIFRKSELFPRCRWLWDVGEGGLDGITGRIIGEIVEGLLLIGILSFRTQIGFGEGSSL